MNKDLKLQFNCIKLQYKLSENEKKNILYFLSRDNELNRLLCQKLRNYIDDLSYVIDTRFYDIFQELETENEQLLFYLQLNWRHFALYDFFPKLEFYRKGGK